MANPIIKVEGLNVAYNLGKANEVRALNDINIEIFPEEFIIFFGPSGCGKSTLLYAISGLEHNIQGNIYVHDKNITQFNNQENLNFHRKTIGMIFQAFYLIPSLTVAGNVTLPQVFLNENKGIRRKKALDLLEYFGVRAQANKLPTELSGGQQQRISISRALINDPEIIMADEPVGNLDSKSSQDVMDILRNLNEKQKKTVILVTHDPSYLSIAHRVFFIRDGRVVDVKVNRQVEGVSQVVIKRDISKELELLINTYSSLSPDQVGNLLIPFKAKQIVSEVMIGMTIDELSGLEKKVENMLISGIYEDESFESFIDQSPDKGGLGLDSRRASRIAEMVSGIVKEIKELEEEDRKIKENIVPNQDSEVTEIRHYLLEEFDVHFKSFIALEVFDQAIKERLALMIDRDLFVKKIHGSLKKGGSAINMRTARKIGRRFELLILGKYK
ncbi:MAG: ABC transporter ATP-binding protein [bacterium]